MAARCRGGAELGCKLTAALADQSQVAEIQAHCCGLLKAGKSWDYIGASVQLMASSQAQQAEQTLLDLGADFTADLEKMARWVELCRKAFREAIDLLKDEKRRVKKGAKASRLGLSATMTEEKREEMLGDLVAMDAKFEMIGSYPELVAEAKLWDGDESKFADPVAMYLERVEAMQAEGLQEEQNRKAAEEATPTFSWSLTPARALAVWKKQLNGREFERVVDFNGVPVDVAVSSRSGERGGDALRRVVEGDFKESLSRWKEQALSVLRGMVSKKRWNDVEQHVRAGKATMDVVKRAIAEGKIEPLPKKGVKVSDEELRVLYNKRVAYFQKRKGEVLDLLERVMSVRSVDESKMSSSVYFYTPYGKVRLSDHLEPIGHARAAAALNLRYDMSDAEVLAAADAYMAEIGGRGARIAKAFHQVEAQEAVVVDVPGVYVESVSEAKNAIKDAYDELKKNPVTMRDGSEVRFTGKGLSELKNHAADRRVLAAVAKMRELSENAVYIDTALNSQKNIPSKRTIERYHYYLSKGNFPGYKEWENARGRSAGASGDAYVMIVVAEEENGDKFYDLDATDVEDVETNKGVAETLEATRVPNAGRQGPSAPKGRIHRVKEYVNHIDAQNGNFSASVTGGKNLAAVSPEMDARYMAAVERGDMDAAQRMVNEVARKRGYLPGSDYQGSEAFNGVAPSSNAYFDTADERYEAWQNGDFEGDISLADFVRRGMDPGELEWLVSSPGAYQRADKYRRESIEAIRKAKASKRGKVTIYRAAPADIKEKSVRNGDWVTFSKSYAEYHISLQDWEKGRIIKQEVSIDDVWWDGNDVNEWGYDDGKEYAYRNTANNRKLLDAVTYDKNGDVVPLSKRFNYRSADVSFSVTGGKNLAAVHSIPVDTMLDVEKKLGGLPKPSIAITRLDKPYSWGHSERVYLIGKPELADPQKGNLVYDRDAWTGKGPFLLEDGGAYDYRKGEYFEPTLEEFVARTIKKKGMEDGSSFRGQAAVAIGTMDAVKAHREKLSDTDTSNAQKAETDEALEELIENVVKLSKKGLNEDEVAMVLARVCWRSSPMNHGAPSEMKTSRDTAKRILNELGVRVKDIKKPLVDSFMKAVAGLQNELEDYLESVPQRAVMFNEWEYAVMPVSMKGTPGLDEMLERNGIKPLWHDGTEEGRRAALAGLVDNPVVSFSVIGRNAKTWGKYTDRAFAGRDDGMWRAEIDARQANLKWEDLRGKNVTAYRKLVAGWDKLPEDVRKAVEAYAEEVYDWQEESDKLNSTPESEFLEQYNKVQKMRDAIKPKREEMRSLLNKLFVEHGGGAAAVLNMKDGELDELAMSLWGPYVDDKVEKALDLRPLWHGGMRLADVMDYPELYEAYPELADVVVRYVGMETANGRAIYGNGEPEIQINRNLEGEWEKIHSILLHEIQHHIQYIEGFAKGGNRDSAVVAYELNKDDVLKEKLSGKSDYELYRRLAGEIEARNVEERLYWNAEERSAIPFNETLEYPGEALVTYSLTGAVSRVLEDSGDEYVANRLREAWQKNLEKWSVLNAGKADSNSAMRAVMEMEGLVKATYDVVEGDAKLGRLYMLQRWAMVYARMVESGELPPKGALKGQAYERFVERLTEEQRTEMRRGMSREQAEGLVRELGVTRLEGAMEKVARECMRAAEAHLKQKETERVHRLLEAAWPKREDGKKSPRGKLEARSPFIIFLILNLAFLLPEKSK